MRGEETLCFGLAILGLAKPPAVILNLGSHWKAIEIDSAGVIGSSVTSLSGEMIHVIQKETILADSVSDSGPRTISREWMARGMAEQRLSGLPRALFCVRLMDIAKEGTPEDRFSFLAGAFIAADLDALVARGLLNSDTRVVISGNPNVAEAWRAALEQTSICAGVLTRDETEKALLAGLRTILHEVMAVKRNEASV